MRIQKLNAQDMNDIKQHEYDLLNEIGQDFLAKVLVIEVKPKGVI